MDDKKVMIIKFKAKVSWANLVARMDEELQFEGEAPEDGPTLPQFKQVDDYQAVVEGPLSGSLVGDFNSRMSWTTHDPLSGIPTIEIQTAWSAFRYTITYVDGERVDVTYEGAQAGFLRQDILPQFYEVRIKSACGLHGDFTGRRAFEEYADKKNQDRQVLEDAGWSWQDIQTWSQGHDREWTFPSFISDPGIEAIREPIQKCWAWIEATRLGEVTQPPFDAIEVLKKASGEDAAYTVNAVTEALKTQPEAAHEVCN